MITLSESSKLSSRVKFRILDFKDLYEKELKKEIDSQRGKIITEMRETSPEKKEERKQPNFSGGEFFKGLEMERDEVDVEVEKILVRKQSVNEKNVTGLNFSKYEEMKPCKATRLKIRNFLNEFLED